MASGVADPLRFDPPLPPAADARHAANVPVPPDLPPPHADQFSANPTRPASGTGDVGVSPAASGPHAEQFAVDALTKIVSSLAVSRDKCGCKDSQLHQPGAPNTESLRTGTRLIDNDEHAFPAQSPRATPLGPLTELRR